ncbi:MULTISPECIES: glycerate kinase [Planococcus]|uniref:Glycerate kinase n=1 Tax=Planococcus faecalis TaxID=1598147 RepID=A0ABM6IPN8_9BACL|nr:MULTISPECIES: glycerate kinase [Planococcus]AQU78496.1 glycerate kinase [Planococcus faecalis]MDJ0331541.1 glycerate kinase [Planococcus sp. S3-L1]
MKIIVAPDSFKGSLSATTAAQAMAEAIQELGREIEVVLLPAADGGEGTMTAMVEATGGKLITHDVEDPLGRRITARYGILGDDQTCVIEIAEASGLTLLKIEQRNPFKTSSFGTGELICHALDAGFRSFIIGLGGSATNDGGAGMLEALGMTFLDHSGQRLKRGGSALGELAEIDRSHFDPRIAESTFLIACDVENVLIGEQGASAVFGPQKGASPEAVEQLDSNLQNFGDVVERLTGTALHHKKGAGAAGGAGGAMQAFFAGNMQRGVDVVLEAIAFQNHVETVDLIVTGEGKSDSQTLSGKTPLGIAEAAKRTGTPVILISGMVEPESTELLEPYFTEIHSIVSDTVSAERAVADAYNQLKIKTKTVVKNYIENEKGC